ncbi:hypothetical protein U1Q18_038100, partial [Sarracenia purpurea var. burkii]
IAHMGSAPNLLRKSIQNPRGPNGTTLAQNRAALALGNAISVSSRATYVWSHVTLCVLGGVPLYA